MGLTFTAGFLCILGEFEKDSTEYWKHLEPLEGEEGQNLSKGHSEEDTKGPGGLPPGGLIPEKSFASFNLGFLQEFIFKFQKSEYSSAALVTLVILGFIVLFWVA